MSTSRKLPTSAEVDRRLRIVSELRNLCLSLGKARQVPSPPLPPTVKQAETTASEVPIDPVPDNL